MVCGSQLGHGCDHTQLHQLHASFCVGALRSDPILRAAAELGPLASLLLAPEEGSWGVDEVTVSSSRTGHTDRFVCKEALGALGAGFLSPVPPGAVVYGSGETAVVLTKARAPPAGSAARQASSCGCCCLAHYCTLTLCSSQEHAQASSLNWGNLESSLYLFYPGCCCKQMLAGCRPWLPTSVTSLVMREH